jgi:hypothetical protein
VAINVGSPDLIGNSIKQDLLNLPVNRIGTVNVCRVKEELHGWRRGLVFTAERLRSAARDRLIINTDRLYRESAASLC